MVASSENTWLMTAVRPCVWGSKKAAKDRPMVELVSSPAASTAANTTRMAKPMDRPISNCCSRISSPVIDIGSMAGGIGTSGASTAPMAIPSRILTSMGTLALPKGGAMDSSPRMRVVGQMNMATQA